ncbi:HdeD family acid-resistance protein [Natronorubrum aibiense]|uniref:HdeD family acid-resistance protein n=1 Tax=Natronorubrum aibiense TaxID=348826 RepID=A0A5P9P4M6_9EURY|nr:DUF308 domain-containing protein [Natronorubrum aibiense]QFU82790.1 HdeD family acid-resistance protein [Natronorubrum aibiense]
MSSVTTENSPTDEYPRKHGWQTLALAGGAVGLIGLFAIAFPFATGVSITIGLGALLVLGGIVHAAHAFTVRGWSGSLWQLTLAIVSVVAGLLLLVNPVVGLASLTILLVGYLLVDGVAELWMATRMADRSGRAAIAVSGVLSLVIAGLLWAGFPASAAWAIGLLVGISLLTTGISMGVIAAANRSLEKESPSTAEPRGA